MQVLFRRKRPTAEVSFVLCDWSCRESFHTVQYLAEQTVPRSCYEIMWVEFYSRKSEVLRRMIERSRRSGCEVPVDTYVIAEMPEEVCFHKHLLYNIGILLASGNVVCFCDSDALVPPDFVAAIQHAFVQHGPVVLHFDEVRNHDRRFWPFRRPSFEDVVGVGCINWVNGRPLGLVDRTDPLHQRNYGACMCALKEDLVAIGGADLHQDYVGHICGPYEMTFRLRNYGRREVWHSRRWLYHVWHPGEAGDSNYLGPHDGYHMSARALDVLKNGSWRPQVECPAIAARRRGEEVPEESLASLLLPPGELEKWSYKALAGRGGGSNADGRKVFFSPAGGNRVAPPFGIPFPRARRVQLLPLMLRLAWRQLRERLRIPTAALGPPRQRRLLSPFCRVRSLVGFLRRTVVLNRECVVLCWRHLCYAFWRGDREVVIYGTEPAVGILCVLSRFLPLRVRAVCYRTGTEKPLMRRFPILSVEQAVSLRTTFLVASFTGCSFGVSRLRELGVEPERIIRLR